MPLLPAFTFEDLLQRLEAGTAAHWDQRWVAEVLRAVKIPPKHLRRFIDSPIGKRDMALYDEVGRLMLEKGMSKNAACRELAGQGVWSTWGPDEHNGGKERVLTAGAIEAIYDKYAKAVAELRHDE